MIIKQKKKNLRFCSKFYYWLTRIISSPVKPISLKKTWFEIECIKMWTRLENELSFVPKIHQNTKTVKDNKVKQGIPNMRTTCQTSTKPFGYEPLLLHIAATQNLNKFPYHYLNKRICAIRDTVNRHVFNIIEITITSQ